MNIVANTRIIESGIFKKVFIPPCTEDSGLALGAAAFVEWKKHGTVKTHSPYLNNWDIEKYMTKYSSDTIQKVAKSLTEGEVIGVCNGFGEADPRALGNRSILACADSKRLANIISMEKKGREWYRPLAPVALEKNTKYFTGLAKIHPLSEFMLVDFAILPERQKELAGTVHANGTARFQTLFGKQQNPFLYDLLDFLDKNYNIKALINTSFNRKGEPIIHTKENAFTAARNMKLDGVVMDGEFVTNFF